MVRLQSGFTYLSITERFHSTHETQPEYLSHFPSQSKVAPRNTQTGSCETFNFPSIPQFNFGDSDLVTEFEY